MKIWFLNIHSNSLWLIMPGTMFSMYVLPYDPLYLAMKMLQLHHVWCKIRYEEESRIGAAWLDCNFCDIELVSLQATLCNIFIQDQQQGDGGSGIPRLRKLAKFTTKDRKKQQISYKNWLLMDAKKFPMNLCEHL